MKSTNKQGLTKVIKVERHHFIEVLSSSNNLVTRKQKKETNFEFEDRKENKQILASQQKGLSKTKIFFFFVTKPTSNIDTYRIVKQNNNINKTTVHLPQLSLGCTSVFRIGRNLVRGGHALIKASRKNWITKRHPLV